MIINPKKKFCFLHIPKCGGTSLSRAFRELDDCIIIPPRINLICDPDGKMILRTVMSHGRPDKEIDLSPLEGNPGSPATLSKHSTYAELEAFFTGPSLKDINVYAVKRNPFKRAVSSYNWIVDTVGGDVVGANFKNTYQESGKVVDFNQAVSKGFGLPAHRHFTPQQDWLPEQIEKVNLVDLDNLTGFLENWLIDQGYDKGRITKFLEVANQRHNSSTTKIKVADLKPESKNLIRKLFADDFNL